MAEIIWSSRAIKDLNEIAEYIAKDSVQYAEAEIKLFFKSEYFGEVSIKWQNGSRA